MTAAELRRVQRLYETRQRDMYHVRTARNRLIREALQAGWTHAQIAEATGLSRGRISQIR